LFFQNDDVDGKLNSKVDNSVFKEFVDKFEQFQQEIREEQLDEFSDTELGLDDDVFFLNRNNI
jgi:hypothetical protein